ncbi:MAG: hypothetical protein JWO15_3305 [Sphingomonadales bacterium]|nr:hypothetical protein [Sphingomonadales bacterium]
MAHSITTANFFLESRLSDAAAGNVDALYELGVAFSSGSRGIDIDLIQAHKWFNLAAVSGDERAQECRAEIADDMSAREVAEAQRQARAWLGANVRRAA